MDAISFDDYGFLISREDQDGLESRSHNYRYDFHAYYHKHRYKWWLPRPQGLKGPVDGESVNSGLDYWNGLLHQVASGAYKIRYTCSNHGRVVSFS